MLRKRTVLILISLSLLAITGAAMILVSYYWPKPTHVRSAIRSPTATWTVAPTATPVPTSTATPTETPSPTPAPQFGPVTFGTGVQGEQVQNTGVTFPAGTTEVYACWSYQDLADGTPYRLRWFLDGNQWRDKLSNWDARQYGSDGTGCLTHIGEYDTDGLPSGNYRLEIFINERQVQMATLVILAPSPTDVPPTAMPRPDIQTLGQQAARSLLQIWVPSDRISVQGRGGSGSVVDGERGLIVTNWHVVGDWMDTLLNEEGFAGIYLTTDLDQSPIFTYWAQVLPQYSNPELDLAVLEITHRAANQARIVAPLGLPSISMGDSSSVHTGDHVLLLGFPDYADGRLSWTEGTITTHNSQWIMTDAGISHGHSGGMMLNEQGALIGIITRYEETSVGGVLALARPINLARPLVADAIAASWASPSAPPVPGTSSTGELMMVLGVENLNLRDGPSLNNQVLDTMPHGSVVEVLQDPVWDGERSWYFVQVQESVQTGWASGVYLAPWEVATSPILFTSDRAGTLDIYRILPDGTGLAQLTNDPGDEGDPDWSPNRDYVVFTANKSGNADLYIVDSAGGSWRQLTSGPARDIHPVWSPDGSRIAFVSDRDGDWEIYVINVDGTELRQVTFNDAWDSFPTWSPDSTRLAYTSLRTGNYDLYLTDLTTGIDQRLTTSPYSDAHPSWVPGGDEIAYTRVVPGFGALLREIGVLNIYDPTNPRLVTESKPGEARNGYPEWSPDGRWIVFVSERDDNQEIYLIPSKGGWAANLSNAPSSSDTAPAWSW